MTSNTRPLPLALQLELTLATPSSRVTHPPADDWRLDEATRCIGRRGVATARALLAQGNPDPDAGGEDRSTGEITGDGARRRPGRAA